MNIVAHLVVQEATAIAANTATDAIAVGKFGEILAFATCSAKTGTSPTMDIKMQVSPDAEAASPLWFDSADAFAQFTDNGSKFKALTANFGKWIRFYQTIGGSVSPAYTVKIELHAKSTA